MKNTNDFSKCKVGDKLWYLHSGKHETISEIREDIIYFTIDSEKYWCKLNGTNGFGVQVAFWARPEIIAPEKYKQYIPFDLNRALENPDSLVTRDGRKVIEWRWFKKADQNDECISCIISGCVRNFYKNGNYFKNKDDELDILIEE